MISLAPIVEPVSVAVFVGGPLSVGALTAVVRPFKVGLVAVVFGATNRCKLKYRNTSEIVVELLVVDAIVVERLDVVGVVPAVFVEVDVDCVSASFDNDDAGGGSIVIDEKSVCSIAAVLLASKEVVGVVPAGVDVDCVVSGSLDGDDAADEKSACSKDAVLLASLEVVGVVTAGLVEVEVVGVVPAAVVEVEVGGVVPSGIVEVKVVGVVPAVVEVEVGGVFPSGVVEVEVVGVIPAVVVEVEVVGVVPSRVVEVEVVGVVPAGVVEVDVDCVVSSSLGGDDAGGGSIVPDERSVRLIDAVEFVLFVSGI